MRPLLSFKTNRLRGRRSAILGLVLVLPLGSASSQALRVGPVYSEVTSELAIALQVEPGALPRAEELRLLEDGEPTVPASEVKSFRDSAKGVALLVCVDISGTIGGVALEEVKKGLHSFAGRLRPQDRMGLMTFGTEVVTVAEPTGDVLSLQEAIAELRGEGQQSNTVLYRALEQALAQLEQDQSLPLRRQVLVISDGKNEDPGASATSDSVDRASRRVGVPINAVAFGRIPHQFAESLAGLARGTGGSFVKAELDRLSPQDALSRIWADLMENRSFVTYFRRPRTQTALTEMVGIEWLRSDSAPPLSQSLAARVPKTDTSEPVIEASPQHETAREVEVTPEETEPDYSVPIGVGLAVLLLAGLAFAFRDSLTRSPPPRSELGQPKAEPSYQPGVRRGTSVAQAEPTSTPSTPRFGRHTRVDSYLPNPGPGRPAAMLAIVSGTAEGRLFAFEQPEVRIGADSSSDLRIEDDEYVSAQHALVRYDSGSLYLSDLGSRNGTFLNDQRLGDTAAVLALGDMIRVGTTSFRLQPAEA